MDCMKLKERKAFLRKMHQLNKILKNYWVIVFSLTKNLVLLLQKIILNSQIH